MKTIKTSILLLILAIPASTFADNIAAAKVPKDVLSLTTRIRDCNHWAGEEPYDQPRAAEIAKAMKQLRCDRLDSDEKKIREKYKSNKEVLEAIDQAKNLPY